MDGIQIISIISRWVHILSAITAVGGSIFFRFVVHPAAGVVLDEDVRGRFRTAVVDRWRPIVHSCVALLLLSGGVNIWLAIRTQPGTLYYALFVVKVLFALGVFFLATTLTSRKLRFYRTPQDVVLWSTVLVLLALAVVLISGILKYLPRAV